MPEIVVVAQRDRVWAGIWGACIQNVRLIRELGQHVPPLLWRQDIPSFWVQENRLKSSCQFI
jgi:hypothetical protein